VEYPPEPWDLRGQLYLSIFAVPRSALPPLPKSLAAVVRPVPIGGRALVGAAWVRYEPGGVLDYRELLAATLTHDGPRPRVSITEIWVDSVASRDGGRALWGIPKDLADLELEPAGGGGVSGAARSGPERETIATVAFGRGVRLPGRWPTSMRIAQAFGDGVRQTSVRGRAGLRVGGAAVWTAEPGGPLGHLAGRRPLLTVTLTDFRLTFGAARS
jgi:hypothetical protein